MNGEKVNKEDLLSFIKKFYEEYGVVPGTGFLAGIYKVTIQTINNNLEKLHKDGRIERIFAENKFSKKKNYSSYKLK